MKYLQAIRLVQFFLFERQDIRLGEITGIFGPNGSGKSSLLDAVQIAMMGGNTRLLALNAQADEQSTTRSLRAYCLGQYGETPQHRARDNAITYITLIWRDSDTNEPISMGVCIHAAGDREVHEVLGRYVIRGVELAMSDHLEMVDGQERPREWLTFRHAIVNRAKRVGQEEVIFGDSQRYIRALLLALKGSGDLPSAEAFTRAFRFALRMRFDKAVDQIVRNDVLEARPTNIHKFKEVTHSFRRLTEMVRQLEAKIADADRVAGDFTKAADESRKAVTWNALAQEVALEQARAKLEVTREGKRNAEAALRRTEAQHDQTVAALQRARNEAMRLRSLKEAHSAHKEQGALEADIAKETERVAANTSDVRQSLNLLRRTLAEASRASFLSAHAEDIGAAIGTLDGLIANVDTLQRERLDTELRRALKVGNAALNELFHHLAAIERELEEATTSLQSAADALDRAKQGRAPLSDQVQRLLVQLRDNGLAPRPVCDLVEIADSEWQPIIESYLGPHLEALLISEHEEKEAFKIYRGLSGQRAIYGVKIVVDSREVGKSVDSTSVAALIQGEHQAAVAYLRRQLGDLQRAETDSEALSGRRTLTRDGMLRSGGVLERLRPVSRDRLRIGGGSIAPHEALQRDVTRLQREIARLKQEKADARTVFDRLGQISDESTVMQFLQKTCDEALAAKRTVEGLIQRQTQTADEEYLRLAEEEREWEKQAVALQEARIDAAEAKTKAEDHLGLCVKNEEMAGAQYQRAHEQVAQARSVDEYDADYATKQWAMLHERFQVAEEMDRECRNQQGDADRKRQSASQNGQRLLGIFIEKYREHIPPDIANDWRKARIWIEGLLARLRETELVSFKSQMDDAYRASQETFRTDVAIALSNNLEWLDETMSRLNKVLANCPVFTNGERYRFRREVRPHLKPLLQFVKDVATHGPTEDLFGGPGEVPEEFSRLLEEKFSPGAAGVPSALDDYREFFEFDIEILREDPITKTAKVVGHLSKRLGPGSGGEHRAPLYVIAGAALASAYRLEKGAADGIRLILLDEAFNKMDATNIVATMRYLEQLGLQVFMASPGENVGILTAFLHRYYDIIRDAQHNVVMIEGHDVMEETRTMFRRDLPEFNEELIEQELAAIRAERTGTTAQSA